MSSQKDKANIIEKRFKHYLFDFFMLFLAVTLGFFVENLREQLVENSRSKDYITSVSEDLKQDIILIDSLIAKRELKNQMLDSLLYFLNSANPNEHGNDIYYFTRWAPRTYRFYPNDRTIQQLNSGNWRLIRNRKVSDALLSYNGTVRSIINYVQQREEALTLTLYNSINKLFDNRVFESMLDGLSFIRPIGNPPLLSTNRLQLNEFCNQIHFVKNSNYFFISTAKSLRNSADKTLAILNNEYKLEHTD